MNINDRVAVCGYKGDDVIRIGKLVAEGKGLLTIERDDGEFRTYRSVHIGHLTLASMLQNAQNK